MPESPVAAALAAIDALDVDAFSSMFAPDGRLMTTDGRVANDNQQVRHLITEFVGDLRATAHHVTAEWHPEADLWIAELDATYELTNYAQLGPFSRAMFLREDSEGIQDLRFYGLHERPLTDSTRAFQEVYGSGRWLPTL